MTTSGITTIGLIGAGHIGSQVARAAIAHGYRVVVSNSRGPETLTDLITELGDAARAGTPQEAATDGDLVVVTVPLHAYQQVPVEPLVGKTVIDTNNYYPQRDGQISAIDNGTATSASLLQDHLPGAHVVKAFNHIPSADIIDQARPAGAPDRRALVIAGDTSGPKSTVTALLDELGFDVVDAGALSESWRIEPGTPGYGPHRTVAQMIDDLAAARRA
ncbi:NADPH-dependent F420 reductase [Sanguibacter antarcticus]|uniref:Pyrroline-5-carboxylate reductase catalytic N-terminal domain-containing protein n=1 Tax=Sanguibacter antarcticus TaxID=372484 RepID=A0A2A9E670_9MICO|nr:NADPH-dependent F420 reductase [Sanguibacter antarcticus]PFG34051.1 hypothetical protein ATL42_1951 [Sanguibacter antarcticus]